ncbi:MAG: glycosyltransferase family 9 protein [bacterium]
MQYFIKRRYLPAVRFIDFLGGAYVKTKRIFFKPKEFKKSEVKKILVLVLDLIGDGILATPALKVLRNNFPDAKITAVVGKWNKEIFENNSDVDKVEVLDAPWVKRDVKWSIVKCWKIVRKLRREKFDLGFDFRGDFFNILLMKMAGIKYTVGYGITCGGWMLNKCAPYEGDRFYKHIVERNLDLLRALELDFSKNGLDLKVYPSEKNKRAIDQFFLENGIDRQDNLILIHPGSNDQTRCWDDERWAEVVADIVEKRYKVILSGGPKEKYQISNMKNQKQIFNIEDQIFEFVGYSILDLAELMKRVNIVLCVNSAALHIAAAQKTPTVCLFAGSYPRTFGPWQNLKSVVLFKDDAKCFPCGKVICENNVCMKEISVEEVIEAVEKVGDFRKL